jgi:hypothetical protein
MINFIMYVIIAIAVGYCLKVLFEKIFAAAVCIALLALAIALIRWIGPWIKWVVLAFLAIVAIVLLVSWIAGACEMASKKRARRKA